jgi:hypothetical protein
MIKSKGADEASTHYKARQINVDAARHGVFAEIGAGQEVARWFFHVGGAAATIAKSISAYDMDVSDAVYGPARQYVSRGRLQAMLDHEWELLLARLGRKRGATTNFFVFADTVATQTPAPSDGGHGWMGVRFQHLPQAPPSEIVLHVRMLDRESVREQEALGILGVNLIHDAFYCYQDPTALISSLRDGLGAGRIEVDMIRFSGPGFPGIDNRLMSLRLVELGLADASMFTPDGEVVQAAEILYKRPVLVERGSFRPVTKTTLDMLERAADMFLKEYRDLGAPPCVVMEMSLRNLLSEDRIDSGDFLARADILCALGKNVMITSFAHYSPLAGFLRRYTRQPVVFALGVPNLREIFDPKYYEDLEGGILEFLGGLFRRDIKLYVYPSSEPSGDGIIEGTKLRVAPNLSPLCEYLLQNGLLHDIQGFNPEFLHIFPSDLLAMIQNGDPAWESEVPPECAQLIKDRGYFGYRALPSPKKEISP